MLKGILVPMLGVLVFVAIVGYMVKNPQKLNFGKYSNPGNSQTKPQKPITIKVKDMDLTVDVADTKETRTKGLSGRTSLNENSGMLFIFDTKNTVPYFWMKDMLIPLDIIWVNDGAIAKIDKKVQPPKTGTPDSALPILSPDVPIDYVLEVNAGYTDKKGIKIGDTVDLLGF